MNNKYKIVISSRNLYREVELPTDTKIYKVGTSIDCDFRLHKELFFEEVKLDFINDDGNWSVMCSDNIYITLGDTRRLLTIGLKHGDSIAVKYQESNNDIFCIEFMVDFDSKKTRFDRRIDIGNSGRISIGALTDNDIILRSEYIVNDKIDLIRNKADLVLEIRNATYGVYHNGNKANNKEIIKNGDFISISDFIFYYKDNALWTEIADNYSIRNLTYNDYQTNSNYPMFVRNTRVKAKVEDEPIKVLDPDTIPTKPQLNIVTSLMPTLMMFALVVVLRGIMSNSGGTYVIFSICSMGMGVVTSVLNIFNGQRKYKKECRHRIEIYNSYIENKKNEIIEARKLELSCLRSTYYSTEENLKHLIKFEPCLFDRIPEDEDFLEVYLGIGRREAQKKIDYKEQEKLEIGDELCQLPSKLSEMFKFLEDAPITVGLKAANAIGVIGEKELLNDMLKCIIVDLISRHYYGDLNLYAFLDEDVRAYDWIRFLPHFRHGDMYRNIVCDNQSKNNIFENLYKELTLRSEMKGIEGFNIILIMNEQGIKSHPISRFIEKAAELNTVFVFFEIKEEFLPLHCSKIVKLEDNNLGTLFDSENRTKKHIFNYTKVNDRDLYNAVKTLAPVYCEEISLESSMRRNISLFELLGIYAVEDLDLNDRWRYSKIYESMDVPLGINSKEEIIYLNLHEKFHGPHGLVAGTTGSGKSEILQSFILSAATIFHPYEIGFVIIDFKGGGMVNQFKDLPHLIGAITNIDGSEIQRSLKSIKAELLKRQSYFAAAGVNHIDKYIQLYKEGKVSEALPHLVIIVDEFAELKAEQPEFMKELVSAARIGRSLGVHLILATQKPSGVVDAQIWSNSKFKLCLKVQSKEDSNEVIKTPLAAEIKEPGRAYLQVGNNEIFELFQSAYSGAPAVADANEIDKEFSINQLSFSGLRTTVYMKKKQKKKSSYNINQLEAIVDYINEYCKKEHILKLPNICLPPLPELLPYISQNINTKENVFAHLGLIDDPDHQSQNKYSLNLTSTNYMIIGSAQTGKTNILQTIIRSVAENYSPKEVNMYIVDFGSMILRNFSELKQVGGVVCSYEDEKLKSLFRLLNEETIIRKAKLAEVGVSSFSAYKEAKKDDLPQIIVLIDNITALKELYLQEDDILLPLCRDGIAVGISFVIVNLQTAGIGYRYLNNFEGRITLFCNETSEYGMMFEGSRMKLPNTPGRALVQIDKTVYECHTYLSFEGEKEYERVQSIKQFVNKQNGSCIEQKAKPIPEIPSTLTLDYINENYSNVEDENNLILGLDFQTILPVQYDVSTNKLLALAGKKDSGKDAFAKHIINTIINRLGNVELYILDDLSAKWSEYEFLSETAVYSPTSDVAVTIISEIGQRASKRYEDFNNRIIDNLDNESWIILVIESVDAISEISNNKTIMPRVKDIIEKYYEMKIFVLFTNIANTNIAFNAPEIMKIIKENKRYLIFDEISNIKLTDIPVSLTRKYAKQLDKNDAYLIEDGDLRKIKVII